MLDSMQMLSIRVTVPTWDFRNLAACREPTRLYSRVTRTRHLKQVHGVGKRSFECLRVETDCISLATTRSSENERECKGG